MLALTQSEAEYRLGESRREKSSFSFRNLFSECSSPRREAQGSVLTTRSDVNPEPDPKLSKPSARRPHMRAAETFAS